ncbi:MAG: hypothetical protein ACI8W8_003775, partial [Rhodothermales bacterium]
MTSSISGVYAWIALLHFLTIVFLCPSASAVDFSQSVNLTSGWNSIWLSVEPQDDDANPQAIDT